MNQQLKITIDMINDPERITSYKIVHNASNKVLARGHYFFIFRIRIGIHLDTMTCRLTKDVRGITK